MTEQELNKISLQLDSWKRFKWEPEWFGVRKINLEIFDKVVEFQKLFLHKRCDGFIDYKTFELIYSRSNSLIRDKAKEKLLNEISYFKQPETVNLLIHNRIASNEFYIKDYQLERFTTLNRIVISYAYTYSSKAYIEIMKQKKTLCHFTIDLNGIVTQHCDLNTQCNDDTDTFTDNAIIIKLINPLLLGKYDNLCNNEITSVKTKTVNNSQYYCFSEKQINSTLILTRKLSYLLSIPIQQTINQNPGVFLEEHIFSDDIKNQLL